MLIIETGAPRPIAVPLGGGAIWRLRPATSFEVTLATAGASRIAAGLAVGEDAVETAAGLLGNEFRGGDFTNKDWVSALVDRLVLCQLALTCSDGWKGVCSRSKKPLPLNQGAVAMVLRDPRISRLVSAAVNSVVHIESTDEKKLRASPTGGAKMDEGTAAIAGKPATAAPADSASAGSSARRSSSPRRHRKAST